VGARRPPKIGSFSLIERVILSAGAMLIFSVSFQIDQMPEGYYYYYYWFIGCPSRPWAAMQRTAINTGPPASSFPEIKPFLARIASPPTDK
jgi:hypothetical protein